jgi:hypothetical protein
MARYLSQQGVHAFLYFFTHELEAVALVELAKKQPYGVFHGSELPLVFDFKIALNAPEKALAVTTVSLWTSFAATGQPSAPGRLAHTLLRP